MLRRDASNQDASNFQPHLSRAKLLKQLPQTLLAH
jgi:hypothetical protein